MVNCLLKGFRLFPLLIDVSHLPADSARKLFAVSSGLGCRSQLTCWSWLQTVGTELSCPAHSYITLEPWFCGGEPAREQYITETDSKQLSSTVGREM